jgi:hypothetical protein
MKTPSLILVVALAATTLHSCRRYDHEPAWDWNSTNCDDSTILWKDVRGNIRFVDSIGIVTKDGKVSTYKVDDQFMVRYSKQNEDADTAILRIAFYDGNTWYNPAAGKIYCCSAWTEWVDVNAETEIYLAHQWRRPEQGWIVAQQRIFIAVGTNGTILTYVGSGNRWVVEPYSPTTHNLRAAASSNYLSQKLVIVGDNGTILTSSSGIEWTQRASPTTQSLNGVVWGADKCVAVGDAGTIITSSDSYTWTNRVSGTMAVLKSVAYGDGKYVAVGNSGTIVTSIDGITWTNNSAATTSTWNSITYGGGQFVAVGNDNGAPAIITSKNGADWTTQPLPGATYPLVGVAYGEGSYVAVGSGGCTQTSPDGIIWTQSVIASVDLYSVAYGYNVYGYPEFFAVGLNGAIYRSDDGMTWEVDTSTQSGGTPITTIETLFNVSSVYY